MSQLIINNKLINAPIPTILETIRKETGYRYFRDVRPRGNDNYSCTCPFHKDGQEMNPSCQVFLAVIQLQQPANLLNRI